MGGQVAGPTQTTNQTGNQLINQLTNQTANQSANQISNQTGTSTLSPFGPAASNISGILGGLSNVNPGLGSVQNDALIQLITQGQAGSPYTGAINNATNSLLGGGGANQYAPLVSGAYGQLQSTLSPFTDPNNLNPYNTPGFGQALATTNQDITNQINQEFAGAGRDLSGANTQTLARGLAQGEGGLIQGQYNQNVANLMNAGNSLFGGGNTAANTLLGMNQAGVGNQLQGATTAVPAALQSQQYGPLLQLQAAAQYTGIPLQNLAAMAGIALPIATAFGTQTANQTGTTAGTSTGTQTGTTQGTQLGTQQGQTTTSLPLWQQLTGGILGGAGLVGATGGFGNTGWLTNLMKP